MTSLDYLNFDLLIEREGNACQANVISSPGGEPSINFDMPFSEKELEDFLMLLGRPAKIKSEREFDEAAKAFGGRLFESVFDNEILACLSVSRSKAREQGRGLRIRLRFKEKENDVLKLSALPWEYLYYPKLRFLSRSSETPVVRYMHLDDPITSVTVTGPLRVLVMISSPQDYDSLDVEKEWKNLQEAFAGLQKGLVELRLLEVATEAALRHELRVNTYHIFHFIGHGGYDAESGDGFLILENSEDDVGAEDKTNIGHRINGECLADILCSRHSLRLAVLNACDAARVSLRDPFGGTAQSLVRAGIPAVIAMQFEITDDAAVNFAKEFYEALADHYPVEAALADARKAIGKAQFGTPALYMRSEDGRIFTNEPPPPPIDEDEKVPKPGLEKEERISSDPDREIYYQMMVEAVKRGKLVFFLGSGANLCGRKPGEDWEQTPYPPSDSELATYLSAIRSPPYDVRELVQVSQYIALESSEFLNFTLHSVFSKDFETLPLHRFLATLPRCLREIRKSDDSPRFPLIVTTNYDDVLERTFDLMGEQFDLVSYIAEGDDRGKFYHKPPGAERVVINLPNEYPLRPDKHTVILKLYGAVDRDDPQRDSYVITEDNYIDHLSQDFFLQIPVNLRERMQSNLVFLGYRLRDWNHRIIFRRIWGDKGPKSHSWVIRPEPNTGDVEFWNNRNVRILNASLDEYVEEIGKRLNIVPQSNGA